MKIQIFFTFFLFFFNLEKATAGCESQAEKARTACDKAKISDIKKIDEVLKAVLAKRDTGAATTVENSIASGTAAKKRLDKFEADCAIAWKNCVSVCENEAQQRYNNQDNAGGRSAEEIRNFCADEPAQNQKAAQAASGNMAQMLPALLQLLASLKGDGGQSGDECARDPNKCATDVASQTPSTPLTSNPRTSTEDGSFLEAGINGNDTPPVGEGTAPSLAQGVPGVGSGSGINSAGFASGSGRSKGVAEGSADTPKINLASAGGGGGAARSVSPLSGGSQPNKGGGNPIASRTSIDGENRVGAMAMEKALQTRGLASDGGQLGGISAAHSFDNFQKIEKRIQAERNRLSEL